MMPPVKRANGEYKMEIDFCVKEAFVSNLGTRLRKVKRNVSVAISASTNGVASQSAASVTVAKLLDLARDAAGCYVTGNRDGTFQLSDPLKHHDCQIVRL